MHAWNGFITNISRLFVGGGLGRTGEDEQMTEDPENRGPDNLDLSKRARSNSVVYRPDLAEIAELKEQEKTDDESSRKRGIRETEQSSGKSQDSDAPRDSRKVSTGAVIQA